MQKRKITLVVLIAMLGAMLAGCAGTPAPSGWPGNLAVDKTVFTASGWAGKRQISAPVSALTA